MLINLSTTSKETTTVEPEVTVPLPLPQTATIPSTTSPVSITSPSTTSISITAPVVLPPATIPKPAVAEVRQTPAIISNLKRFVLHQGDYKCYQRKQFLQKQNSFLVVNDKHNYDPLCFFNTGEAKFGYFRD
jgi:hypothetical protein